MRTTTPATGIPKEIPYQDRQQFGRRRQGLSATAVGDGLGHDGGTDSGELHVFNVADLSYAGREAYSGEHVVGSAFDGTHL